MMPLEQKVKMTPEETKEINIMEESKTLERELLEATLKHVEKWKKMVAP